MEKQISTWLVSNLFLYGFLAAIPTQAQIIPDATLPVNSVVTPSGNTNIIEGGTSSGTNLFHSFREFSVPTGGEAFFNNSPNIQNIFSRVTGQNISNIDGLIRANGTANLFLLNPNGIIFGPNAQLNIGGSFLATTANSFKFADGTEFSATNPQQTPLLTVNVPVGLQFGTNPGRIINRATNVAIDPFGTPIPIGLQVQPGKTLALVGGDILMQGGGLTASGGAIELGSVADNSLVSLIPTAFGFTLGYESVNNLGNLQLEEMSRVDASGDRGGDIQLQGRHVTLNGGSRIVSSTLGLQSGGGITVVARESLKINGTAPTTGPFDFPRLAIGVQVPLQSGLFTDTFGTGDAGNIRIDTQRLIVSNGASINASANRGSLGKGGDLLINASESIEIFGTAPITVLPNAIGKLLARPGRDAAFFDEINASTSVVSAVGSTGDGGNVTINTGRLIVRDGGFITTATYGAGKGGNLTIDASNLIEVSGTSASGAFESGISTSAVSTGASGNLTLETGRLIIRNGASIGATAIGEGAGGEIFVLANDAVEIRGSSTGDRFFSNLATESIGLGNAGSLTINTRQLTMGEGGIISVSSSNLANAGNLDINANTVRLSNSKLTAETAAGEQGNITLQTNNLQLRRGSSITTNATGNATGGNININSDVLVALENSDISANSAEFQGGTVTINAQGIFGTQFREQQTEQSDITATGANSELSGTVEINQPEVDANSGLVQLPENFSDISNQIVAGCSDASENSFVITGRGGLPEDPTQTLRSRTVWQDLRAFGERKGRGGEEMRRREANQQRDSRRSESSVPSPHSRIIEASGWKTNSVGQIELVGNSTDGIPTGNWNNQKGCNTPFF